MVLKPLEVLRKGLKILQDEVKGRKTKLQVTDEDICQAVLDARRAQENALIGGGDDDVSDNAPIKARPTCCHQEKPPVRKA